MSGAPRGRSPDLTAPSALVAAVDRVRWHLLRWAAPVAGRLAGDRALRVWWLGLLTVASSLGLVVLAPRWALWAPLVLGVPHLVADVRYLVVQPGLHRRPRWALPGALVVVGGLLDVPALVGVAVAAVAALAAGGWARRAGVAAAGLGCAALAHLSPAQATAALAFFHNLIGVALWWAWRPRAPRMFAVLALLAVSTAALAAGALGDLAAPLPRDVVAAWNLPGVPLAAERLVVLFLFLQAVHYGVWLRLVPEDARRRPAPRPLAQSLVALEGELGRAGVGLAGLATVGVLAWGVLDAQGARAGYLWLASFHAGLEVAVAGLWLIEGRRA